MNILGIGILFAGGAGTSALQRALKEGWRPPAETNKKRLAYLVDIDAVPDKAILKKIRRSDRVSQMSVLAAVDALRESGIENVAQKNVGVIIASAYGAQVTSFDFIDDILDYGDANVSPTLFSNSVHNAAASYISSSLGIKGPTLTVTRFRFSFYAALQLAQSWLGLGRCDYVLVGAVDEYGDVLGYASEQKLKTAADGKIRPFAFKPTCHIPGEGAAFFLMGKELTEQAYCAADTAISNGEKNPDLTIIAADGMMPDETAYLDFLGADHPTAGFAPLFGTTMDTGAFSMAAAALMLKKQELYASPIQENPHGVNLIDKAGPSRVESIRCLDIDCSGEKAIINLTRV